MAKQANIFSQTQRLFLSCFVHALFACHICAVFVVVVVVLLSLLFAIFPKIQQQNRLLRYGTAREGAMKYILLMPTRKILRVVQRAVPTPNTASYRKKQDLSMHDCLTAWLYEFAVCYILWKNQYQFYHSACIRVARTVCANENNTRPSCQEKLITFSMFFRIYAEDAAPPSVKIFGCALEDSFVLVQSLQLLYFGFFVPKFGRLNHVCPFAGQPEEPVD